MTYHIFAVGGTGTRCLESFIFLCAMGLGPSEVDIYIIDPDAGNGNANRAEDLAKHYQEIRQHLKEPSKGSLFFTSISLIKRINPHVNINNENNNLKKIVNYNGLNEDEQALLDLLYSKKELNLDLTFGYRARPSIGSLLMSNFINNSKLFPWDLIIQKLKKNEDDKVFLFSSVFGGTGASGFPVISRMIKNQSPKTSVGGSLILPYFHLNKNLHTNDKDEILPDSANFIGNTISSCQYYKEKYENFDSVYIIGEDFANTKIIDNYSIGNKTQINDSHFIELLAGYSAINFWENKKYSSFMRIGASNPTENIDDYSLMSEDLPHKKKNEPFEKMGLIYNYLIDLNGLLISKNKKIINRIGWLRKLDITYPTFIENSNEFKKLIEFMELFKIWIWQMSNNAPALKIIDSELNLSTLLFNNKDKYRKKDSSYFDKILFDDIDLTGDFIDKIIKNLNNIL